MLFPFKNNNRRLKQGVSEIVTASLIKGMAEESTINQMKSEKIDPEDADEKANTKERLTITEVPPKILSRYLSGPRRSCHDLCKYGIPHAVEAKPWSKTNKRVTKKERKTKVSEENVTSLAGNKKSGSRSKPSQTSKTEKDNSPVDIKELTYEKTVTTEKISPPFEETGVSLERNNSDLKQAKSEPSLPVQECSKSQTKWEIVKNKTPAGSSSRNETKSRSKQPRKSSTGGKEKPIPPSTPLSSKHDVKKPQGLSSKSTKNMTREFSLKSHENVEEVKPELASSDNLPDKILHVTEPASANSYEDPTLACDASKLSSPLPSSSGDKSLKHTNKKTGKSAVSASSNKGLISVAGNKWKANMLYRTRNVPETLLVLSSISSSNSSLGKQSNATSKSSRRGHDHQGENVKMGYKIRQKMNTKVGAASKVVVADRKLTFRRGKVIEIQPQSNNIPRRLKFRPVRILGDDMPRDINCARKRTIADSKVGGEAYAANTKSEKVVSKLQTVEGSEWRIVGRKVDEDKSKIESSKSESDEKVVLRHQSVEEKKENPRLYNNVIEETASILAEQRRSKVKALVSAFESVISLDSSREAAAAEVTTAC